MTQQSKRTWLDLQPLDWRPAGRVLLKGVAETYPLNVFCWPRFIPLNDTVSRSRWHWHLKMFLTRGSYKSYKPPTLRILPLTANHNPLTIPQTLHVCHIYLHWGGLRGQWGGMYGIHGVFGNDLKLGAREALHMHVLPTCPCFLRARTKQQHRSACAVHVDIYSYTMVYLSALLYLAHQGRQK